MIERTFPAELEELDRVNEMITSLLNAYGCPAQIQSKIGIATDELFSNIARYAYAPSSGNVTVRVECELSPAAVVISFFDNGKPYDPLKRSDPDITLSAEERKIGGLGIYMVKKIMDDVSYAYVNSTNILTIKKYFEKDNRNE